MIQEEKLLLLKDICGRLQYKPTALVNGHLATILGIDENVAIVCIDGNDYKDEVVVSVDDNSDGIKPYLRPMSSMNEEELTELAYKVFQQPDIDIIRRWVFENKLYPSIDGNPVMVIDWLNKKMFDYRGLIEKGLALEVTEENNSYKE